MGKTTNVTNVVISTKIHEKPSSVFPAATMDGQMSVSPRLRVLELFSGVGGMHFSLRRAFGAAGEYTVVAAVDINEVANKVYKHNFPDVIHVNGNICGLTAKKLNGWGVNAIMMSPPCQPFTRQGLKKDVQDTRTQPLLHILKLLP